jgi:hypothetical protein
MRTHAARAGSSFQRSPLRRRRREAAPVVVAVLAVHGLKEKRGIWRKVERPSARAASTDESCSNLSVRSPAPVRATFQLQVPVVRGQSSEIFDVSRNTTENAWGDTTTVLNIPGSRKLITPHKFVRIWCAV